MLPWIVDSTRTTLMFLSNASHKGLGDWCWQYNIMWRVTKDKLCLLGYIMAVHSELSQLDPPGIFHISMLEIAFTINVWLMIAICQTQNPHHSHQQHIRNSYLTIHQQYHGWCMPEGPTCHTLANLLVSYKHFSPSPLFLFQFQYHHISGHSSEITNLLSHPSHTTLWGSIIRTCLCNLYTHRPHLALHRLLSELLGYIAQDMIAAMSATKTITYLIPELCTLPPGWQGLTMMTYLCK